MAFNVVHEIDENVSVRNVLVSVYDKTGLADFVRGLVCSCPSLMIYSTGGTFDEIARMPGIESGVNLLQVSAYTGQPEMQGGLVKTLDWKIYLGLLSEPYNAAHDADLARVGAVRFDMVVGNLYPFQKAMLDSGVTAEEARQNVDIGGPCMLRASAKNWIRVASVSSPTQYGALAAELRSTGGALSARTRWNLAVGTFSMTAAYDAAIASFLSERGDGFSLSPYEKH